MLQDDVPAAELGAVNGVQGSVCAAFEMASFVASLALRTPRDFDALMAASCAAVALSLAMMAHFAWRTRGAGASGLVAASPLGGGCDEAASIEAPLAAQELRPLAQERAPLLAAREDPPE